MEFNEFRKMICEKMEQRLGKGYQITEYDTEKINGIVKQGISIRREKENVGTICYLKQLYDEFLEGIISDADVIGLLWDMLNHNKYAEKIGSSISWVKDWDKVKDLVKARLINTAKNTEMLEKRVHMNLLDLSVIFHLEMSEDEEVTAALAITNEMMEVWGMDKSSLLKQAVKNMESEGIYLINAMTAQVQDIVDQKGDVKTIDISECEMYVLTRKTLTYGAAAILSPRIRKWLCENFEEGVYILPSSTHEMMFVPKIMYSNVKLLEELVRFENITAIEPEDYLGDKIYTLDDEFQLKYAV